MLTCQQMVELVTDFLEGRLSWTERLRFHLHLGMCRHCRRYVRQMKTTIESTGQIQPESLDPVLRDELLERFRSWNALEAQPTRQGARSMFPPTQPTASFPYRILGEVGRGGMGIVYRAEDLELGRTIALKVIKPEFLRALPADEIQSVVQRFIQEARAAAAISHPGAVTVYRVGQEGGWPFIAMELLQGTTLEQWLKGGKRMTVAQTIALGMQVLGVLSAAHDAGVIHRDVKPANLMLLKEGRVKLTDFGIARVSGAALAQTQAGSVLGTPRYGSPEQLAGRAIDSRSDLYSLGVLLYEAVCGRPPFDAAGLYELMQKVQTQPPAAPSFIAAGIPPSFDAVLLRALEKRPEDRFESARAFAAALQSSSTVKGAAATAQATVARPALLTVDGGSPAQLVVNAVRAWDARALGSQDSQALLAKLLDRPIHAPAFCGALELAGALLLICDGLVLAALRPDTGLMGDQVLEELPPVGDAVIFSLPPGLQPRTVQLLASLLHPPREQQSNLDASITDLPQLAQKLANSGFDGALRFTRGSGIGFALFSQGRRVLDLFGRGWPAGSWEGWISQSGAIASVEPCQTLLPTFSYRQQLKDTTLEVIRPSVGDDPLRSDAVAEAQALQLVPVDGTQEQLRRGAATVNLLVEGDPAYALARWALTDLPLQFTQFGRASRWKSLVGPMAQVRQVCLHHDLPGTGGGADGFDVVTYGEDKRVLHVMHRAASGSVEAVRQFLARVKGAKEARSRADELGGAILLAPRFTPEALDTYWKTLKSERTSLLSGLDAFTHTEGYLRLGLTRGLHILLVEEESGRPRPLVPG